MGTCRYIVAPLSIVLVVTTGCGGQDDGDHDLNGIAHLSGISSSTPHTTPTTAPAVPSASASVTISPTTTSSTPAPTVETSSTTTPPPNNDTSPEGEPSTDAPDPMAQLQSDVIDLTNSERERRGCGPVEPDERLLEAARGHSKDMATRDFFDHTSPEGDGPGDRASAAGYESWGAENIAMGYDTAAAVMDGWMNSEGHRANILNCDLTEIGVGVANSSRGLYWTQMFGFG